MGSTIVITSNLVIKHTNYGTSNKINKNHTTSQLGIIVEIFKTFGREYLIKNNCEISLYGGKP